MICNTVIRGCIFEPDLESGRKLYMVADLLTTVQVCRGSGVSDNLNFFPLELIPHGKSGKN